MLMRTSQSWAVIGALRQRGDKGIKQREDPGKETPNMDGVSPDWVSGFLDAYWVKTLA